MGSLNVWEIGALLVAAVFGVAYLMDAWSRNIDDVFEFLAKMIAASFVVAVIAAGIGIYWLVS